MKSLFKDHKKPNDHSRSLPVLIAAALLSFALVASCAMPLQWGDIPMDIEGLSAENWLGDLDALSAEMRGHPKLGADQAAAAAFDAAIAETKASLRAAGAEDPQELADIAVAGIQKALAAIGDGHTRINASSQMIFPVILKFFPDTSFPEASDIEAASGWDARIAATDAAHQEDLGAIVAKIGDKTIAEAVEAISAYLSLESAVRISPAQALFHYAIRFEIMDAFTDPWLMRSLGLADGTTLTMTIQREGQSESTVIFNLGEPPSPWVRVLDSITETPFTRSHPGSSWWYGSPAGCEDIVYFRYDDCSTEARPVMDELLAVLPDMDDELANPSHLIVDLRYNSGGDSRPGTYFARNLTGKKVSAVQGGVIILVSGATYSSAMMNTADIMKACGATGASAGRSILMGEPLIEPLRHYGEIRRFPLPNSGIMIGRSTRLWKYDETTGIRPARGVLEPAAENIVVQGFDDYAIGRDTTFERALEIIGQD
ncbi:MAG: hypothetical protein WC820_05320 [Spirochaetales bacterium]|jgi:hypothetical protein